MLHCLRDCARFLGTTVILKCKMIPQVVKVPAKQWAEWPWHPWKSIPFRKTLSCSYISQRPTNRKRRDIGQGRRAPARMPRLALSAPRLQILLVISTDLDSFSILHLYRLVSHHGCR
jgi:hypothetical protein